MAILIFISTRYYRSIEQQREFQKVRAGHYNMAGLLGRKFDDDDDEEEDDDEEDTLYSGQRSMGEE